MRRLGKVMLTAVVAVLFAVGFVMTRCSARLGRINGRVRGHVTLWRMRRIAHG